MGHQRVGRAGHRQHLRQLLHAAAGARRHVRRQREGSRRRGHRDGERRQGRDCRCRQKGGRHGGDRVLRRGRGRARIPQQCPQGGRDRKLRLRAEERRHRLGLGTQRPRTARTGRHARRYVLHPLSVRGAGARSGRNRVHLQVELHPGGRRRGCRRRG